jgi:hypothetical protein
MGEIGMNLEKEFEVEVDSPIFTSSSSVGLDARNGWFNSSAGLIRELSLFSGNVKHNRINSRADSLAIRGSMLRK